MEGLRDAVLCSGSLGACLLMLNTAVLLIHGFDELNDGVRSREHRYSSNVVRLLYYKALYATTVVRTPPLNCVVCTSVGGMLPRYGWSLWLPKHSVILRNF